MGSRVHCHSFQDFLLLFSFFATQNWNSQQLELLLIYSLGLKAAADFCTRPLSTCPFSFSHMCTGGWVWVDKVTHCLDYCEYFGTGEQMKLWAEERWYQTASSADATTPSKWQRRIHFRVCKTKEWQKCKPKFRIDKDSIGRLSSSTWDIICLETCACNCHTSTIKRTCFSFSLQLNKFLLDPVMEHLERRLFLVISTCVIMSDYIQGGGIVVSSNNPDHL